MTQPLITRASVVRRGERLVWATIAYNSIEAVLSLGAGIISGSVALVGFGLDSVLELTSGVAGVWRLRADLSMERRERAERLALRTIGICFLILAAYVLWDAVDALVRQVPPEESRLGIAIAVGSLIVMPFLARAKRQVASRLGSRALTAEARQTQICTYLSAILLVGLVLNAFLGWWWADPVAGLAMVPFIAWEGLEAVRGRTVCADCSEPVGLS